MGERGAILANITVATLGKYWIITHQPGAASPAECVPIIPHGQSGQHTVSQEKKK